MKYWRDRNTVLIALALLMGGVVSCGGGGGGGGVTRADVSGTILDSYSDPVAGALVTINSAPVTVYSDTGGYFAAEVEVGDHTISVTLGGAAIYEGLFSVPDGSPVDLGSLDPTTPGRIWYKDADDDSWSDGSAFYSAAAPAGYDSISTLTALTGDCDDGAADIHPGAADIPDDGIDQDCDGSDATLGGLGGILDTAFGGGAAVYDSGNDEIGNSVAIQADGKVLVAGDSHNGIDDDLILVRFNSDGTLDTTFGTGGAAGFATSYDDTGNSVAVQADGKAVVVGESAGYDIAVWRFTTSGTLDTTFGTGGVVLLDGGWADYGWSVAVQTDQKILAVGYSYDGADDNIVLVRLQTNGTLDPAFGTGGVAVYDSGHWDIGLSVVLQTDGKALVAGVIHEGTNMDVVLVRFNSNGTLDATFGVGGAVRHNIGGNEQAHSVAVQADGRILVAGMTYSAGYDMVLLRFNANGTLDTTFGTGGVVTYNAGPFDYGRSVAVQSDQKILAAGTSQEGTDYGLVLWRFNTSGTLDTTFGTGGVARYDSGGSDWGISLTIQADGKALVAGRSDNALDQDLLLVRFK